MRMCVKIWLLVYDFKYSICSYSIVLFYCITREQTILDEWGSLRTYELCKQPFCLFKSFFLTPVCINEDICIQYFATDHQAKPVSQYWFKYLVHHSSHSWGEEQWLLLVPQLCRSWGDLNHTESNPHPTLTVTGLPLIQRRVCTQDLLLMCGLCMRALAQCCGSYRLQWRACRVWVLTGRHF